MSQSGFLSDPIKIKRGCRQGDPISCYEFILAAEILALMITINTYITGLTIGTTQYKLTQFADDTTLILDGSLNSLQAALNTLEIYGTLSGLKVNSEKTKVIWIGKRRNCREKLNASVKLNWGETQFKLLGIHFSINLENISQLNYKIAIDKVNSVINHWKKRNLTPFGKITVIKTLLLPQFNHIFTSVLVADKVLDEINKIFFKFLWDGNVEKIRRSTICKDYKAGGLKMIDVRNFQKALKLGWLKRIIRDLTHNSPPWLQLLSTFTGSLNKLTEMGPHWCNSILKSVKNPFWKYVFVEWAHFWQNKRPENMDELIYSSLWYNNQISKETLYLPHWQKKGIRVVGDILDKDGEVLSIDTLKTIYGINAIEFDYYRVKALVKNFKKNVNSEKSLLFQRPYIPTHVQILLKSSKVSQDFYQQYNKQLYKSKNLCQYKWNKSLEVNLTDSQWSNIYQACFYTVSGV